MKTLLMSLLLVSTSVFAERVTVLDIPADRIWSSDELLTRFHIDKMDGQGSASLTVMRTIIDDFSERGPRVRHYTMLQKKAVINGLQLEGDQFVFKGSENDVNCGVLKPSRILKRPTLYLSGNCALEASLEKVEGGKRLKVDLVTK